MNNVISRENFIFQVDTFMLASHMEHLHPESQGIYRCPHCPPELKVAVPFDEVEFHLRCHGELLFKVIIDKYH